MRQNVLTGDTPFRRAHIRSVIDQVEVPDAEIRIVGRRTDLERLMIGGGAAPAGVPSFVRGLQGCCSSCLSFPLAAGAYSVSQLKSTDEGGSSRNMLVPSRRTSDRKKKGILR